MGWQQTDHWTPASSPEQWQSSDQRSGEEWQQEVPVCGDQCQGRHCYWPCGHDRHWATQDISLHLWWWPQGGWQVPGELTTDLWHHIVHIVTKVSCTISSGDMPIDIQWRKDGRLFTAGPGVQVQNNVFSSNILFFSLAAEHSGSYTCVAINAAAAANFTAQLIVRGKYWPTSDKYLQALVLKNISVPPRWELEPRDVTVSRHDMAVINCAARGNPRPTISWRKSAGRDTSQDLGDRSNIWSQIIGDLFHCLIFWQLKSLNPWRLFQSFPLDHSHSKNLIMNSLI